MPALFVASVSNGSAPSITTFSSAEVAVVSFTPSNGTEKLPSAGTVTVFGAATGVGPSISVTVACAPVSWFRSEMSATTSIARVDNVCGGACTAATTRSGRANAVDALRSSSSLLASSPRKCTFTSTLAPRGTCPRPRVATPPGASTSLTARTSSPFTCTRTCLSELTAASPAAGTT